MNKYSFLKWAGGKAWLVNNHACIFPEDFSRYIEPFLGGGSVFFYLKPQKAILSDVNSELIKTYLAIRDEPEMVEYELLRHAREHSTEHYYAVRNMQPTTLVETAARMIYLNRTCFNDLYRANQSGFFNTPKGSREKVIMGNELFHQRSALLKNADLMCCDFEGTIELAREGDLVYCDPPYVLKHDNNYARYSRIPFTFEDQERLSESLKRAASRGVKVLMSNINHPDVLRLYKSSKIFDIKEISRRSSISANGRGRGNYPEVIISCNM